MQRISTRPPVAARPKRRRSARTEIASPATLGGKVRLVELRKSSTQFAQSSPPSKCPTQVPAFKVPDPRHEPSARSIVRRSPAVMIAVLCRACADRAISSNQPVRVRASNVLALCCSASGLERSNREDEGGAERTAAAHGACPGLRRKRSRPPNPDLLGEGPHGSQCTRTPPSWVISAPGARGRNRRTCPSQGMTVPQTACVRGFRQYAVPFQSVTLQPHHVTALERTV